MKAVGVVLVCVLLLGIVLAAPETVFKAPRFPSHEGDITFSRATGHAYSFQPATPFKLNLDLEANHKRSFVGGDQQVMGHLQEELDPSFMNGLTNFFQRYTYFGLSVAHQELTHQRTQRDKYYDNAHHLHFSQMHQGIPVFGTYLKVHTDEDAIQYVNGVVVPNMNMSTTEPTFSKTEAEKIAIETTFAEYEMEMKLDPSSKHDMENLEIESTSVVYYHNGLTRDIVADVALAYYVVVAYKDMQKHVKQKVFIDAHTGVVINHYSAIPNALSREVWRTNYGTGRPVYVEGDPIPTETDPKNVVEVSGMVYNTYKNMIGFDSFNNKGAKMIGVYNLPPNDPYAGCPINANWNGRTINFCPTLARTDVSVHEWSHAYTQFSHGLEYQYQSGALNEAYSDIVAEAAQIMYNVPKAYPIRTDINECVTMQNRWIIGDELTQFINQMPNGLRDALNPNCNENPRSTQDPLVWVGPGDNGGVHANSGIPNQAFAILTDGGTLDGVTVQGIGAVKALSVYLRASSLYQGPSTNFKGHALALARSCRELIGKRLADPATGEPGNEIISSGDCDQVQNAMEATLMSEPLPEVPNANPPIPYIVSFYPSASPIVSGERTSAFVMAAPNLISGNIGCGFVGSVATTTTIVPGTVFASESHTGAFCSVPETFTVEQTGRVALTANNGRNFSAAARFTLYKDPSFTNISPVFGKSAGGTTITLEGEGFQDFKDCTPYPSPDVNGDSYDCFVCVFGSLDLEFPVKATFIPPNKIECKMPPQAMLVRPDDSVALSVSMNNFAFYPELIYIDYVDEQTSVSAGGTYAAIIVPGLFAIAAASLAVAMFLGKAPGKLENLGNNVHAKIEAIKSEGGPHAAKFYQISALALIVYALGSLWTILLSYATRAMVYAVVATVFTLLGAINMGFGHMVVKSKRPFATQAFKYLMILLTIGQVISIALLGALFAYFQVASSEIGSVLPSQSGFTVISLLTLIILLPFNIACVVFAHKSAHHFYDNAGTDSDRKSHIEYVNMNDDN